MGSAAVIEASLGAGLATAQALDLGLAVLSLALFLGYHVWYYSWHLWVAQGAMWERGDTAGSGGRYHRLDMTGQSARYLFTRSVLATASDADYNLAVQTMRNPITAASILATGASVGVTTLLNVVLDSGKMAVIKEWSAKDPLTGGSSIISPEAKLLTAVGALFLSFFSLAQALRLFVHFPFIVRASAYCRSTGGADAELGHEASANGDCLASEAINTCLRGQTFFSLGLRFLYAFIPLVIWTLGGTFFVVATAVEVVCLYLLDQL